jgi:hypothetical protein
MKHLTAIGICIAVIGLACNDILWACFLVGFGGSVAYVAGRGLEWE